MRAESFALDRTESTLALAGRVLMSGLFFYSALGKVMAPENVITRIAEAGLPLPQLGYAGALLVEIVIGLMFLVGFRTRLSALVLAAWCVLTALLFHLDIGVRQQNTQLLKNLAIAGGMVQFVLLGAGRFSIDWKIARSRG